MKIAIDIPHRYACMRAHTATHLLHAELGKIFPQTKQAGSYVGPDELRFDFFAERGLTNDELQHIAHTINTAIMRNDKVTVQEMKYADAIATGGKAFFEDTYPEVVRVVSIVSSSCFNSNEERGGGTTKDPVDNNLDSSSSLSLRSEGQASVYSVELCGGTHVRETSQIGAFVIIEQTAVAAGVKRIVALTGPKVAAYVGELSGQIERIAHKVSVPVKQLDAKIEKIIAEDAEMTQKIERLTLGIIKNLTRTPGKLSTYNCDGIFDFDKDIASLGISFSEVVNSLRSLGQDRSWLITTTSGQYALFHPQAKQIAQELGLKGGGSDMFVQGRDEAIVGLKL